MHSSIPESSPRPGPTPALSIWQGIGLTVLLAVGLTLFPLVLRATAGRLGFEIDLITIGIFGNSLAFLFVLPLAILMTRLPLRRLFPLGPIEPRLWPAMLVTLTGWLVLAARLDLWLQQILPVPEEFLELFRELFSGDSSPVAQLVLLVLIAPLTEELFFRGVLLQGFRRRYAGGGAVIASAILFAALHANPWQFLPTLVLGIYFGWWCVRTGSLWPALAGHAFHNGMLWLAARGLAETIPAEPPDIPLLPNATDLFGLILMIAGTMVFKRQMQMGSGTSNCL